jgi:sulfate adenylyltransferase subunit 1 (EFTu-like GTPase family)
MEVTLKGKKDDTHDSKSTSMDSIMSQLSNYVDQIRQYLDHVEAKVEGYKFAVEKRENGVTIDVAFRASVTQKDLR